MTLETAKKLKEAGWNKETEWGYCGVAPEYVSLNRKSLINPLEFERMFYPCPSLEELLSEMPNYILHDRLDRGFRLEKTFNGYFASYEDTGYIFLEKDPTEAVAQLYLKLKQENLL